MRSWDEIHSSFQLDIQFENVKLILSIWWPKIDYMIDSFENWQTTVSWSWCLLHMVHQGSEQQFLYHQIHVYHLIFGREDINLIAVEQERAFVCWSQKLHPWLCTASKGWFQIKFCFKSTNLLQFLSSYTLLYCTSFLSVKGTWISML